MQIQVGAEDPLSCDTHGTGFADFPGEWFLVAGYTFSPSTTGQADFYPESCLPVQVPFIMKYQSIADWNQRVYRYFTELQMFSAPAETQRFKEVRALHISKFDSAFAILKSSSESDNEVVSGQLLFRLVISTFEIDWSVKVNLESYSILQDK